MTTHPLLASDPTLTIIAKGATLVPAVLKTTPKLFKDEALAVVTNFHLGKSTPATGAVGGQSPDVTFAPPMYLVGTPLNINFNMEPPTIDYKKNYIPARELPVDGCVKPNFISNQSAPQQAKQQSLARIRNIEFASLCTEFNQGVRSFIELSLTMNNPLVDTSKEFLALKAQLVTNLTDIGDLMERMTRDGEPTPAEVKAHNNGQSGYQIQTGEAFQTHEIVDKGRHTGIVSLRDRAEEVVGALDAVFAKYKVGEHAPNRVDHSKDQATVLSVSA